MTWSVLDSSVPEDRARWLALWSEWPAREVAAHPSYVALFAQDEDRALCAIWRSTEGAILFPIVLRRIGREWWGDGIDGYDLEGPYGYGGPFLWGQATSCVKEFWEAFDQWASDIGVVAAFARLSLFTEEVAPILRGEVAVAQMNVVRNLLVDDESLLRDYEHKVRKNIKRATASGLTIEFDQNGSRLDEFFFVYDATMVRRRAGGYNYFERPFFERICQDLPGQYVFAHAMLDGCIVSTELVLLSETHAYSFLGGTISECFHLRPNDLLKHEVARWARDHGKSAYVLGGGYGGDDGIYRYKRSFAPRGEHEFRVWQYVVDADAYDNALRARRAAALSGPRWDPREGFFPAYRG